MYEKYFGFTSSPFASAPDPNVFYLNPVYQSALGSLRHGLAAKNGLIVLTGPVGTGKTVLLAKLFGDLGSTFKPVWFGDSRISFSAILRTLLAELGGPSDTNEIAAMIDELRVVLLEIADARIVICLVIEGAEELDGETLEGIRQLSNFEGRNQKLLQLILVGQPQLMERLEEPQNSRLKQRVALHCRLFPLSRGELERYIIFRLQAAGYFGTHLFEGQTIDRIARYSAGIPRLVNILCDNALLAAYRSSKTTISPNLIDQVAGDLALVPLAPAAPPVTNDRQQQAKTFSHEADVDDSRTEQVVVKNGVTEPQPTRAARTSSAVLIGMVALAGSVWALYSAAGVTFPLLFNSGSQVKKDTPSRVPAEMNDRKPAPEREEFSSRASAPEPQKAPAVERFAPPPQPPQTREPELPDASASDMRQRAAKDPAAETQLLRTEVQKAIENRAIAGVSVRLVNRTVYLEGVVASERQKALAEKAARGAGQGRRVENHIRVQHSG